MNNKLPDGWERSTDPSTGRLFYINHHSMQTSWTPPIDSPLTDGWQQKRDGEGRIFFYNEKTNKKQWNDPRLNKDKTNTKNQNLVHTKSSPLEQIQQHKRVETSNIWSCSVCTFDNKRSNDKCAMCDNPNPTALKKENINRKSSPINSKSINKNNSLDSSNELLTNVHNSDSTISNELVTDPSELQPYLVPDKHSSVCTQCAASFDWKVRRHHCKCCGSLLCKKCSSSKTTLKINNKNDEVRVCRSCFDHLSFNEHNCYLRCVGILLCDNSSRDNDHITALKGIVEIITALPKMMESSASVAQQTAVIRTLEMITSCGGTTILYEMINPNKSVDFQIQASKIILGIATVATECDLDNEACLSLDNISNEMVSDSIGMKAIKSILVSKNSPWEAQMHLTKVLYLLGDCSQIQNAVYEMKFLPPLCDFLLTHHEQFQKVVIETVNQLIKNNSLIVEAVFNTNGIQSLMFLLSSENSEIKNLAASTICFALELEISEKNGKGPLLASKISDAFLQCGGIPVTVKLLDSKDNSIIRSGLQLLKYLSKNHANVIHSACALPRIVSLLANHRIEYQANAANIIHNIALSSSKGSKDVLESGAMSMIIPLLDAEEFSTKISAASLCRLFATNPVASNLVLNSGGISLLIKLLNYPDVILKDLAAEALIALFDGSFEIKESIIKSGGMKALINSEIYFNENINSRFINIIYGSISDDFLLKLLLETINQSMIAMKLLEFIKSTNLSEHQASIEKVLLIIGVLCGAQEIDTQTTNSKTIQIESIERKQQQTSDLVATNGGTLIVPLLYSVNEKPAIVLAALRVLLQISKSNDALYQLLNVGAIHAVLLSMISSFSMEGSTVESNELIFNLQLFGLNLLSVLCRQQEIVPQAINDLHRVLQIIVQKLSIKQHNNQRNQLLIQEAIINLIVCLSNHKSHWQIIIEDTLPQLVDMFLVDSNEFVPQPEMLINITCIFSNIAKLEINCQKLLQCGVILALTRLLSEKDEHILKATLNALISISLKHQVYAV